MSDGIFCDNTNHDRVEPLISVELLKKRYLFGVDTTDGNGNPLEDEVFQSYINTAVSMLEHSLDISITPRKLVGPDCCEKKDYNANDYWQWSYFQLNNVPIIDVLEVRAVYPNANILKYPKEWNKLQKHDGILRLIPTAGSIAQFQVDAGGQYFPEIFRYNGMVPLVWEIDYIAGFEDGKIPIALNSAIGLLAAVIALVNTSDNILGPGVASQSISLDGLAQSVALTASAENNTHSAKIADWKKLLWGDSVNSRNQGMIAELMDYYQGQRLNII